MSHPFDSEDTKGSEVHAMKIGNEDCPDCGGYGYTVPDNAPPGSYERTPCAGCCCSACHAHTAAGEACATMCDARMRDAEKLFDAQQMVREWRRDARAVA